MKNKKMVSNTKGLDRELTRAVDPHSLYADPDPAVFLNADPDPGPGPA